MQLDRPLQVITPTVDGDVLVALAGAESAFTGRGVHRLVGRHSADGVRRALDRLARQGIVSVAVAGPSKLYSLNRKHLAAPSIIALAHQRDELLTRMRAVLSSWPIPPAFAALFGSAVDGHMRPESDIDVLIVGPGHISADASGWTGQLQAFAHDATQWTGNDVRVLEMSEVDARLGVMEHEQVLIDIRDHGIWLAGPSAYLRSVVRSERRG